MSVEAKNLTFSYEKENVLRDLSIRVPEGEITVFIGANGCGKSTLLRTMARLIQPEKGNVLLNGKSISELKTKEIAKQLSILPQGPTAPEGLTVEQLVKQGRYPHQSWLRQWSPEDEKMVENAMEAAAVTSFRNTPVDDLSGGQRQRAWIAMTLAQGADTLLLDEPTTYLDMAHQIDVLDLLYELNEQEGRTIVMVLHDINLACRYADHLVALQEKSVFAQGRPGDIVTKEMVRQVFHMNCHIAEDPVFHTPMVIPYGKGRKPYGAIPAAEAE
ncbi:ABC transporter ATP-binding protein [Marinococcus luteus]|uniref:ABC transporter ATP-binding protein n=1 Tax=Marinococcus luteus TaxID=1122204 RepID=UPI002ACD012A|nr:ABC transporter ATP-binding protein [Marinococcus luteus]MDZ5781961.1 ABC transporter ATP-binding protein [Marinococcus luteus]